MKKAIILIPALAVTMLTACGDKDAEYDASGVFETTEVIVSAKGTGEIVSLNIELSMLASKQNIHINISLTHIYSI